MKDESNNNYAFGLFGISCFCRLENYMTRETADILRKAKALIDTPEKWTQGAYGRTPDFVPVSAFSLNEAACLCSVGAIAVAKRAHPFDICQIPEFDALIAAMGGSVIDFNDNRTHSEVMFAFDRAIQQEEQGE